MLDLIFKQVTFLFFSFFFKFPTHLSSISLTNKAKIIERFVLIISNNSSSLLSSVLQIVNDTLSEACVRVTRDERQKMKALFGSLSVLPGDIF